MLLKCLTLSSEGIMCWGSSVSNLGRDSSPSALLKAMFPHITLIWLNGRQALDSNLGVVHFSWRPYTGMSYPIFQNTFHAIKRAVLSSVALEKACVKCLRQAYQKQIAINSTTRHTWSIQQAVVQPLEVCSYQSSDTFYKDEYNQRWVALVQVQSHPDDSPTKNHTYLLQTFY